MASALFLANKKTLAINWQGHEQLTQRALESTLWRMGTLNFASLSGPS